MGKLTKPKPKPKPGSAGGSARAKSLSPTERKAAASKAATARWKTPVATHNGEVCIGELVIPCYVLPDGRRLLSRKRMVQSLGMSPGGTPKNGKPKKEGVDRLERFATGDRLRGFMGADLITKLREPVTFRTPGKGGATVYGYEATILADICDAVLRARADGVLQRQQEHIAKQCEILVRGFARIGIIALVDEATGYQYERSRDALALILETFIAKELAQWVKTFPDDFYREIKRLRGLPTSQGNPSYFGHLTNDIVYARLAPGVLDELRSKNPKNTKGHRGARHHQHLTRTVGHPKLQSHLHAIVTLMKVSDDWEQFIAMLNRTHPKYGDSLLLPFTVPAP